MGEFQKEYRRFVYKPSEISCDTARDELLSPLADHDAVLEDAEVVWRMQGNNCDEFEEVTDSEVVPYTPDVIIDDSTELDAMADRPSITGSDDIVYALVQPAEMNIWDVDHIIERFQTEDMYFRHGESEGRVTTTPAYRAKASHILQPHAIIFRAKRNTTENTQQ